MAIDDCKYDFRMLATEILPRHMARMEKAIRNPILMTSFTSAPIQECRRSLEGCNDGSKDFFGCYVLIKNGKAIYTGISRKVISRLRQHVKGGTHYNASLTYRIAKEGFAFSRKLTRDQAMAEPTFKARFDAIRTDLASMSVAVIRIDCPVELYGFELYCAMKLDTCQWNSFRTH